MTDKSTKIVPLGILIGIAVGAALGAVAPGFMQAIDFIGRLFINALQLIAIPLIVAAIISGVASFGDLRKIGRTASRILAYFAATSAVAVLIGVVLALIIKPGEGSSFAALQNLAQSGGYPITNVSDMLSSLLPLSFVSGVAGGHYLALILFSIFTGGVLATMGAGARTVTTFFRQLNDVMMKLVRLLLIAAPVGVFSLAGSAVAANTGSWEGLSQGLGGYALAVLIGLTVQALVVLPIILARFTGQSPIDYLRDLSPALMTALGTGSSTAALPVTYTCAVEEAKVDPRAGAQVLPLGALANLNGTAISVIIAALFLANVFGVSLSALQIVMMVLTTLLVSIGAAGMPMATPVITTIVLGVAGFTPVQILAGTSIIIALDWLVDRGRALVNVWGDAVGVAVIAETFEFKTARRVAPRSSDRTREGARSPRTRTRSDGPRGRTRPDSRTTRKPERGPAPARDRRPSRPAAEKPSPQTRGGRSRGPKRTAEADSPFGISAPATPMLDVEGGAPSPVETHKPEPVADRKPQRTRQRDDSAKPAVNVQKRETAGDRGRGRRPDREAAEPARTTRRPAARERKPVARRTEDVRSQPPRESKPPVPAPPTPEPQAPIPAPQAPRPEPVKKPESPPVPSPEAAPTNGRLSPATVARELAKVSRQLADSTGTEKAPEDSHESRPEPRDRRPEPMETSASPEVPKPTPAASENEPKDRSFPASNVAVKVSPPSDEKPASRETKSRDEQPEPQTSKPSRDEGTSETQDEKPVFGRSRSRRGPKPSPDEAPRPDAVDEEKPKLPSGYTTDSASFGRGKKKRVR